MKLGSLFTGYGGLEMAAGPHFGAETAWCSDIDVPNLGDITRIDWTRIEPIDVLTGGWPCQPFSHAGKRRGAADERAFWPEVARAVRALRPRYVFLENVAAIASAGELARAVGDLAALGYVGSWRSLRAADVGAPHGRLRIFILATDAECGGRDGRTRQLGQGRRPQSADGSDTAADTDEPRPQRPEPARRRDMPHRSAAADAASDGRRKRRAEPARLVGGFDAAERGATPADTESTAWREAQPEHLGTPIGSEAEPGERAGTNWGVYEPAIRRWESFLGRPAPAPTEPGPKSGQRLSPWFVEFMMGLPEGWVTGVPGLSRNAQLKALGNGVVPQQAAAALRVLTNMEAAA